MLYVFKEQMQDKYNSLGGSDVFLYALHHLILWSGIVMFRSNNHQ